MTRRHADFSRVERDYGIILPGATDYVSPEIARDFAFAMDALPTLVTTSNAGIPAYLTNFIDPDLIRVLVSPMQAADILGEVKKGDWTMTTATFPIVENTGEVSAYGDYSDNGSVGMNVNFPMRQSYHYQTITQWGEKTLEMWGAAKIGMAAQLNVASALTLNKFQNRSYFFGISGLQNYGLLNDPSLSASLQPGAKAYNTQAHGPWVTAGVITATANEVYSDIQSLYVQLNAQANGTINMDQPMTLAMSPGSSIALTATNSFNVSVADLLKKNFPNITVKTAVEYDTAAGELVQLIATSVDGQDTGYCAFTEKMRAHPIVVELSAYKQKKSQGTWGAIIRLPFAISSMLGV
jgi:hypothetical protein